MKKHHPAQRERTSRPRHKDSTRPEMERYKALRAEDPDMRRTLHDIEGLSSFPSAEDEGYSR